MSTTIEFTKYGTDYTAHYEASLGAYSVAIDKDGDPEADWVAYGEVPRRYPLDSPDGHGTDVFEVYFGDDLETVMEYASDWLREMNA